MRFPSSVTKGKKLHDYKVLEILGFRCHVNEFPEKNCLLIVTECHAERMYKKFS